MGKSVNSLAFCDDLILFGYGEANAQKVFINAERIFGIMKLRINVKKTEIINFLKKGQE